MDEALLDAETYDALSKESFEIVQGPLHSDPRLLDLI
jgi:hypothetical protein